MNTAERLYTNYVFFVLFYCFPIEDSSARLGRDHPASRRVPVTDIVMVSLVLLAIVHDDALILPSILIFFSESCPSASGPGQSSSSDAISSKRSPSASRFWPALIHRHQARTLRT